MLEVAAESRTHTAFCAEWGVSRAELDAAPESLATMAYGAYLIDVGLQGQHSALTPHPAPPHPRSPAHSPHLY